MRLIDADYLREQIQRKAESSYGLTREVFELMVKVLDVTGTVDAVEVVRCEFCEYYVGEMFFGREVFWCNRKYKQGSGMMELTDVDDFCSRGERKTDG